MSLIDAVTDKEVERLSFETVPDIGTGTAVVMSGDSDTLVDPTKVVEPEVTATFMVAATGWRLRFVTDR